MDIHVALLPERADTGDGGRVGRHVEHDPRSRSYAVRAAPPSSLRDVAWRRNVPVFDQGNVGSCTGQAMAGLLSTWPFRHHFHEPTAFSLYKFATHLDDIPGAWPTDTGSSGLAVAKAAELRSWIRWYNHAFSIDAALTALMSGPVITGIPWYDSFDRPVGPDAELVVSPNAEVRGGHEFEVLAVDVTKRKVRCVNSWSDQWGDRGYMTMSWSTWEQLLEAQGDVTVPIG